ncbi:SAM-dependent methyltransferase [Streptomyces sp. NPDC050085]|uniref:SAM-dependent methyltransferase n=1 Tax=Streptomyces sp. NPDC050085 TaxID=3365600 RepID=UPI00379880C7
MHTHEINAEDWNTYGQRQLGHAYMPPVPERLQWGPWEGVGPGSEVLGDLTSQRVLDIGCGPGHHAVHVARAHGARVTGIEQSPTQHRRAIQHFGDEPGVNFLLGDVVRHLRETEPYDAAYAVGTLDYIDPHQSRMQLCGKVVSGTTPVNRCSFLTRTSPGMCLLPPLLKAGTR